MSYNSPPWHPISSAVDLKHLGKFSEELTECASAVSRCIIQGMDEKEPVTGKVNRRWLEEEIADVMCTMALVLDHFELDRDFISQRVDRKMPLLKSWHEEA